MMKLFASTSVPTPAHSERVLALWLGPRWKTESFFKYQVPYKMCHVDSHARAGPAFAKNG